VRQNFEPADNRSPAIIRLCSAAAWVSLRRQIRRRTYPQRPPYHRLMGGLERRTDRCHRSAIQISAERWTERALAASWSGSWLPAGRNAPSPTVDATAVSDHSHRMRRAIATLPRPLRHRRSRSTPVGWVVLFRICRGETRPGRPLSRCRRSPDSRSRRRRRASSAGWLVRARPPVARSRSRATG
jgi:hypothetical protein